MSEGKASYVGVSDFDKAKCFGSELLLSGFSILTEHTAKEEVLFKLTDHKTGVRYVFHMTHDIALRVAQAMLRRDEIKANGPIQ